MNKDDFLLIKNFSNKKAAKLLARDEILARCIEGRLWCKSFRK